MSDCFFGQFLKLRMSSIWDLRFFSSLILYRMMMVVVIRIATFSESSKLVRYFRIICVSL